MNVLMVVLIAALAACSACKESLPSRDGGAQIEADGAND